MTVHKAPAVVEVPQRPLPSARFAVVDHEQHHGRPITINEPADRLAVTPDVAGQLLATINPNAVTAASGDVDGARAHAARQAAPWPVATAAVQDRKEAVVRQESADELGGAEGI